MTPPKKHILAINGGSSSIKFAIFSAENSCTKSLEGEIDRIGLSQTTFKVKDPTGDFSRSVTAPDHSAAATILISWIEEQLEHIELIAIGHRVVHGGPIYYKPQEITTQLIEELHHLSPFDPEHLPQEILLIEAFRIKFPNLRQLACFDTAFHHNMPQVAKLLPIPRRYEAQGIRRYGFHGLSYEFLMQKLSELDGPDRAQGRIILAHLGSGVSLAAVHDGKSIDTSMSFTPTSGVPMSTRSGDLDPGIAWYLARTEGIDAKRFHEIVNFESGLLGISETSPDMRDLLDSEVGDFRAAEAITQFCYQIKKCIGSFAAALGGLDTLVFSGGIGENSGAIRSRICDGLEFLGIKLESRLNRTNDGVISEKESPVTVRVIHTDEEFMIAKTVYRTLKLNIGVNQGRIDP